MADIETEVALAALRDVLLTTKGRSRRHSIRSLGIAAAGSTLLGTFRPGIGSAEAAPQALTMIGWGGPWKDAIVKAYNEPFTKMSGIPVDYISPYDYSKVRLMDRPTSRRWTSSRSTVSIP